MREGDKIILESQKPKYSNRVIAIDYLKAISIMLIILTHSMSAEVNDMLLGPFWIDMAVPIFIIISGITFSLSADRKNIDKLSKWFSWNFIKKKLTRILIPYGIILTMEIVTYMVIDPKSLQELTYKIITGGWGPGSYYIPILMQLLVVFPILYLSFKKHPKTTMILTFGLHLGFDIVSNTLPIAGWIYRLLIFRYLAFIVVGIMLYHYPKMVTKKRKQLIFLALLSGAYIWTCTYYGYMPLIFTQWNTTSLPTVFWALSIVILGLKHLNDKEDNSIAGAIKTIGKASLHIYLVQMAYFHFEFGRLGAILNMLLCIIIGTLFYYIERRKTVHIKVKLRNYV